MADTNGLEVKTGDYEVEISEVDGDNALNIVIEAVNEGDEIDKEVEAMAEAFEAEANFAIEVDKQLGETITTDLEKKVMEEVFGDVEKETIPTDKITEIVPEVFFQEESPVDTNNGPSAESIVASTLEEYNEEMQEEFENLEELEEEEELTNLVEKTTSDAIALTFDGTDKTVTLPDDTNLSTD